MYISKAQLDKRIEGEASLKVKTGRDKAPSSIVQTPLPRETKVLAGVLAKFDTQQNVANALGTTQGNVSNISRGINGSKEVVPGLKEEIDSAAKDKKEIVTSKSLDVLFDALTSTGEHLKTQPKKALLVSSVAKNLALVHEKISGRSVSGENGNGTRVAVIINAPPQKSERDYESVEVMSA